MNREKADEIAKVMQAYANGKEVQFLGNTGWRVVDNPSFDTFFSWRVKPATKRTVGYRQYYFYDENNEIMFATFWEDCNPKHIQQAELSEGFIKWKHTEWQYDDVEVE